MSPLFGRGDRNCASRATRLGIDHGSFFSCSSQLIVEPTQLGQKLLDDLALGGRGDLHVRLSIPRDCLLNSVHSLGGDTEAAAERGPLGQAVVDQPRDGVAQLRIGQPNLRTE